MRLGLAAVAASLVACGPLDIGTRYVKSWPVTSSAQALQLLVEPADDLSLAGTELDIPANTLPANVDKITLEVGLAPLESGMSEAGPVLIWAPEGTSLASAQFKFPYSADGGTFGVATPSSQTLLEPTIDSSTLATVTITELTAYEPVLCSNCATDAGPGPDAGPNDGGPEDAGFDAGEDGGFDAGEDAGPGPDGGVLDGGTCTTNQECASGVCLNGTCT